MKIEAAQRLTAVRLARAEAYTDAQGLSDLAGLQKVFDSKLPKILIGKNTAGFSFWWLRNKLFIACVKDGEVCGFIALYKKPKTVLTDTDETLKGVQISLTFMAPAYRGKGLMLGMHQYLATEYNLISDDVYTPQGLMLWKQLKKLGLTIEVINGDSQSEKSWTEPRSLMLIRKTK